MNDGVGWWGGRSEVGWGALGWSGVGWSGAVWSEVMGWGGLG